MPMPDTMDQLRRLMVSRLALLMMSPGFELGQNDVTRLESLWIIRTV